MYLLLFMGYSRITILILEESYARQISLRCKCKEADVTFYAFLLPSKLKMLM